MKKNIYLLVAVLMAVVMAGCEPKGFEQDNDGKVISVAVKEAVYVTASQSMQISFKDNIELQLTVVTIPRDAAVTFSNKHPEVLEVTATGLLKPKAVGKDTLTVTAADGSVSTKFVVNIIDHMVKATAINVDANGANIQLKVGGADFDLGQYVTLVPADTWDKTVNYTSNDATIATVNTAGIVTPGAVGTTTITIRTADGSNLEKEVNVTVQDKVQRPVDVDRTGWTVTTQTHNGYGYMWDGNAPNNTQASHVTGKPEHMFDGKTGSYLSLVKPGGAMSGVTPPVGSVPSFTVDMQTAQEFEYIKWSHRNGSYTNEVGTVGGNNYNYLRVYGIILEGSNDGDNFTVIPPAEPAGADANIVWIPQKVSYVGTGTLAEDAPYTIMVTKSTYRYVRVKLAVQSKNYGTGEGKYQHPDYPGAGATSGNSMQVAEFGLGVIVIE